MMTELTASDGHMLECWMEPAAGKARGGLVILQEIFGVTDQLKGVARRYAAEGYAVAIPALFDRSERGCVVPFDQAAKGRDMMMAADLDQVLLDVDAAVQALPGKVGVMGFCWGGGLALRAAQKLEIDAGIAFYGTRLPQYLDSPLKAPMLGHFGAQDDHVPSEMLDKARAYLPEWEIHMYDAGHAFANDARPAAFNAEAAELAHLRSLDFLKKHVG